jgi:hypothetical protein
MTFDDCSAVALDVASPPEEVVPPPPEEDVEPPPEEVVCPPPEEVVCPPPPFTARSNARNGSNCTLRSILFIRTTDSEI